MRQVILDTETTGLEPTKGHRIIEVGCVELLNRRLTGKHFHYYLNPDRDIEAGALAVHGLNQEFLADKPRFPDIAQELWQFIEGAELIIHNAPFDMGFLKHEWQLMGSPHEKVVDHNKIIDTLALARKLHPGQKNNLDALCKRYHVDNTDRTLHGALLDAKILALVYLAMTGGQGSLFDGGQETVESSVQKVITQARINRTGAVLRVQRANIEETNAHQAYLAEIAKKAETGCVWLEIERG